MTPPAPRRAPWAVGKLGALGARWSRRAFAGLAAWSGFTAIGLAYGVYLLSAALGARQRRTGAQPGWRDCSPGAPAFAALGLGLVLSLAWTPASATAAASHLWPVAVLLMVPWVVRAWPARLAGLALRLFVASAAVVGLAHALSAAIDLPASNLWRHALDAEGNQRIAGSLLLALASVLALDLADRWRLERRSHGSDHEGLRSRRAGAGWIRAWKRCAGWAWGLAAAACTIGVAVQDRRSGMLLWPLLLLVFGLSCLRRGRQRGLALLAVAALCLVGWTLADGVRARFAEGMAELQVPADPATVATSWGQRRVMAEGTLAMIQEAPWVGHGVGSWPHWWRQAMPAGSAVAANTTPHSEVLLAAAQLGVAGALLLLAGFAAEIRAAWRAGPAGRPALLIWSLLAVASLFNAVIRDAKFALPLLLLAALAASVRLGHAGPRAAGHSAGGNGVTNGVTDGDERS